MSELTPHGDAFTALILEIFRVNRLLLEAGDDLTRPVGLSSARWQVLGVVEHGPTPVANVARVMGLTRQSVQQTADSLVADGLLAYTENPHHRRAKLMALTPKGREALDYVAARHAEWANQISENQTVADLHTAVAVLHALRERLDQDVPLPPNAEIQEEKRRAESR